MRRVAFFAAVAWCGCGVGDGRGESPALQSREQAIIGGTTDTSDPEVFELLIQGDNGAGAGCTGTLIAPHTLLTAAHCVDPRTLQAGSIQLWAHNKLSDNQVNYSDLISVSAMRFHPQWSGQGPYDIGLALLEKAPNVTPKPWNQAALTGLTGSRIRVVGYGASVGGTSPQGGGLKRQVSLIFDQIFQDLFFLGDGVNHGICHGDSGGPSFYTFPDGVERVVGVHSFTSNDACTDGADTRVDFYQSFIKQWINEKEPPSCGEDGRCAQDCPTLDLDCVCGADGQCTAACPDLRKDPDCPPNCGLDGVCSLQQCPVPDGDCAAAGTGCSSDQQCTSRHCVGDGADKYCSATCQQDSECFGGARCDSGLCKYGSLPVVPVGEICDAASSLCASGSRCAGPTPDFTYCSVGCSTQADCTQAGATCEHSFDRVRYCKAPPRPKVVLDYAASVGGDAGSCAAAPGLLPLLALALLHRRRRARPGLAKAPHA